MFEAEIRSIDSTKKRIPFKYQPILYIRNIRQVAKILKINDIVESYEDLCDESKFLLSSDTSTKILFEFMYFSEYVTEGSSLIIYDDLLKAYGKITEIYK